MIAKDSKGSSLEFIAPLSYAYAYTRLLTFHVTETTLLPILLVIGPHDRCPRGCALHVLAQDVECPTRHLGNASQGSSEQTCLCYNTPNIIEEGQL
jgi:hypothetical protein